MRALLLAMIGGALGGCGYPAFGFASDGAVDASVDVADASDAAGDVDAAVDTAVDAADASDASCDLPVAGDLAVCTSLPHLKAFQVVDGVPSEFCGVPATVVDASNAALTVPSPLPAPLPSEKMLVRAAWSSGGVQLHVHVDDASIRVVPDGRTDLFQGDSVEIFASGVAPTSGSYVTDHAVQIDIAPPSGTTPARSQVYAQTDTKGPLDSSFWAARLVPGGYELEVRIPWSMLGGVSPAGGATIGFDVALNVDYDATKDASVAWFAMASRAVSGASMCGTDVRPACDSRTFCVPTLSP